MSPPSRPISPLLWLLFLFAATAVPSQGVDTGKTPLSSEHGQIYSVTAGRSVPVSVTFENPAEVAEIRVYFKTMAANHYLFLPMAEAGRGTYTAILPPARNWTRGVDYLLLCKSIRGESRKTKPFRLLVMDNFNSPPPSAGETQVEAEDSSAAGENDFAVPLRVVATSAPLLASATEDPYPPITMPGTDRKSSGIFGGQGGMSFSIKIGGVSFRYRSSSGR